MPTTKVFKTRMRWERAARMESMGFSDNEISLAIGITPAGLHMMKRTTEYQQIRLQIASRVLSELDEDIADDTVELRSRLRQQVPLALQAMADALTQNVDPKLRLEAAAEVLDRDGRMMKASRQIIEDKSDVPEYMTGKDDEVVQRILASQQSPQIVTPKTKDGETIQ